MEKNKYVIYVIIASLLWGTLNTAIKLGYAAYGISSAGDIFVFAGTRFLICGMVMIIYSFITDRKSLDVRGSVVSVLLSGGLAIVLSYGLQYIGLMTTDSSKTGLLKQTGSLLYVCFSFMFFKDDKFSVKKLVGALIGFAGVVVLSLSEGTFKLGFGESLIILASVSIVAANIINKKAFCKVPPIAFTGITQLFGGMVLMMVGRMIGGGNRIIVNPQIWLFIYICIASVVSYCLWYTATHKSVLSGMLITKFAEPFFAAVTGAIFLEENILQLKYFLAFVLIVGGICLSSLSSKCDCKK